MVYYRPTWTTNCSHMAFGPKFSNALEFSNFVFLYEFCGIVTKYLTNKLRNIIIGFVSWFQRFQPMVNWLQWSGSGEWLNIIDKGICGRSYLLPGNQKKKSERWRKRLGTNYDKFPPIRSHHLKSQPLDNIFNQLETRHSSLESHTPH